MGKGDVFGEKEYGREGRVIGAWRGMIVEGARERDGSEWWAGRERNDVGFLKLRGEKERRSITRRKG